MENRMKDYMIVNPHKTFDLEIFESPDVYLMMQQWFVEDINDLKNGTANNDNSTRVLYGLTKKELFFLYEFLGKWFDDYFSRNKEWQELVKTKKEENV